MAAVTAPRARIVFIPFQQKTGDEPLFPRFCTGAQEMAINLKKKTPLYIILLLAIAALVVWFVLATSEPEQRASAPTPEEVEEIRLEEDLPMAEKQQPHRSEVEIILQRQLFGKGPDAKKSVIEAPVPVQLAATTLELSLLGTITGAPEYRRAIIHDKKKKGQEIYGQGDSIQGRQIKEIQRDRVILTANGKDEVLLPEIPTKNAPNRPPSFRPGQPAMIPPVVEEDHNVSDAEPPEPESVELPGEPMEGVEPADSPPDDIAEPGGRETGNLPPIRQDPSRSSLNRK